MMLEDRNLDILLSLLRLWIRLRISEWYLNIPADKEEKLFGLLKGIGQKANQYRQ